MRQDYQNKKMRVDRIEYHSGKIKYFQIVSEHLTEDLLKRTEYEEIAKNLIPRKQLKLLHEELRRKLAI